MKIDNRFLLPFVMPFVVLGMLRILWWVAGSDWSDPGLAAVSSMVVGTMAGTGTMAFLFAEEIEIGHITLGKGQKE